MIGRKNWLFSTSVKGAEASMILYSIIITAKSNNIDSFNYISQVLNKIPNIKTADDLENLLPLSSIK